MYRNANFSVSLSLCLRPVFFFFRYVHFSKAKKKRYACCNAMNILLYFLQKVKVNMYGVIYVAPMNVGILCYS